MSLNVLADDTIEYAAQGALFVDWMQTRYIVQHPYITVNGQVRMLEESNPILGKRPSAQKVNLYFPTVMATHYELYRMMDDRWRPWFDGGTIAAEMFFIIRNKAIGVNLGF